jgi:hypothetical protein
MATEALKHESTFIEAGLPGDFVKQLRDTADTVSALIAERRQRVAERAAATEQLITQIREARRVVRVLDAFVLTTGKDNVELIVAWKILKRVRQPNTRSPQPGAAVASEVPTPAGGAS